MEKTMMMVPLLIVVGGLGVAIGMYIAGQVSEHIRTRVSGNKIEQNMKEWESRKQKESSNE